MSKLCLCSWDFFITQLKSKTYTEKNRKIRSQNTKLKNIHWTFVSEVETLHLKWKKTHTYRNEDLDYEKQ